MDDCLVYVEVQYDFEYDGADGNKVGMKEGEVFVLIRKTNNDWWQVIRDGEKKSFYAPASYLEQVDSKKSNYKTCNNNVANTSDSDKNKLKSHSSGNISESNGNVVKNSNRRSSSLDKLHLFTKDGRSHHGLLFNNPLYNVDEDECLGVKPFSEPDVDYSDEDFTDDEKTPCDCDDRVPVNNEVVEINCHTVVEETTCKKEEARLQQRASPIYANLPLNSPPRPPSPSGIDKPIRKLHDSWAEYEDVSGRKYYHNSLTREKSWKPPRRKSEKFSSSSGPITEGVRKHNSAQDLSIIASPHTTLPTPIGWSRRFDEDSGEMCFFHDITKAKWFSSVDDSGRTYYYQENASESFWQLPEIVVTEIHNARNNESISSQSNIENCSAPSEMVNPRRGIQSRPSSLANRGTKSRSMVLTDVKSSTLPRNSSNLSQFAGYLNTTRQGILNKTKLTEGGKRLRKNWCPSFVILSEVLLLFYKDMKSAQQLNKPPAVSCKPETSIDLAGALIEWATDKSSRKNVFQISTVFGLQLLLQDDSAQTSKEWFEDIQKAISRLPSGFTLNSQKFAAPSNHEVDLPSPDETKKPFKFTRKYKGAGSSEDLGDASPAEKKIKIKDKLLNFFLRRPTMESLREKGIIREEPVFGCNLHTLCAREKTTVPKFVQKCIAVIEHKDMKADGLYRASGNLSQVQKMRFQINQDNTTCLDTEDDIHVLTGALKMFFRELKEPLIPFNTFGKFLSASMLTDQPVKIQMFSDLIFSLPRPNYDTLKFLFQHLLRVTECSEHNRMHVQNLAIVFGPTLMWTETESTNLALDMMYQNQIIEFLLLEFFAIFR